MASQVVMIIDYFQNLQAALCKGIWIKSINQSSSKVKPFFLAVVGSFDETKAPVTVSSKPVFKDFWGKNFSC